MTIGPSDVPLYVQLANRLREQILSGAIPPTQPLPSKRALQREYGVALRTAERAFRVLRAEGLEGVQVVLLGVLHVAGAPELHQAQLVNVARERRLRHFNAAPAQFAPQLVLAGDS